MKLKNALILLFNCYDLGCCLCCPERRHGLCEPFTFNGVRSIIGGLVLIPVILVLDRKRRQKERIIRHLVTEKH